MQSEAQTTLDNECRELLAVHHIGFIVAESGQIHRGYTNSDHGIDGEIEFKDDQGRASGKRLYVQLKSGDSYLKKRRSDGAEVFQIKNPRWADYWQQQAFRHAGHPHVGWRNPLDGRERLSQTRKRRRENGEADRLRGRAVRCGERAKLAEEGVEVAAEVTRLNSIFDFRFLIFSQSLLTSAATVLRTRKSGKYTAATRTATTGLMVRLQLEPRNTRTTRKKRQIYSVPAFMCLVCFVVNPFHSAGASKNSLASANSDSGSCTRMPPAASA